MKISARNVLAGKVLKITKGTINAEVILEVAPEVVITAQITVESAKKLGLKKGKPAYAVIKSDSVMVAVD